MNSDCLISLEVAAFKTDIVLVLCGLLGICGENVTGRSVWVMTRGQTKQEITIKIRLKREY